MNLTGRIKRKLLRLANIHYPLFIVELGTKAQFYHSTADLSCTSATVTNLNLDIISDTALINRIIAMYQKNSVVFLGNSMWKDFFTSFHEPIHAELMGGNTERVASIFRNPESNDLFYGFDLLSKQINHHFYNKRRKNLYARLCLDGLVRFAQSVGAVALLNPESWSVLPKPPWETEEIIKLIKQYCWQFSVPNPYPGEHGVASSLGVISSRIPHALYQAWRIKELVKGKEKPRVLEIGAGLGRTAYYCHELGIKDYTIIDIPLTAAAQAYFLGRTLSEENIYLEGESTEANEKKIKILSPQAFLNGNQTYDVIINVDSLTEMDLQTASNYWQKIKSSTRSFLSINHESNLFRVHDIIQKDIPSMRVGRFPYWLRHGYVEEIITIHD